MGLRSVDRLRSRARDTRPAGAPRRSVWSLFVPVLQSAHSHRTTGHAAEMAFFAVLTLVPSTVAVGSALGLSKGLIGDKAIADTENAATDAIRMIMGPDLADDVISPFVHEQLAQPRGGVALGGLLIAWWLSSRLFEATGHALDSCYSVRDRRPSIVAHCLALAFALGSVLLVALTVQVMVIGPLGDASSGPASDLGIGGIYGTAWAVLRWPVLLAIVVAFLVCLYRFSPNVRHSWRDCLPGAVLGAALWIIAAVAFRLSTNLGLHNSTGVAADDPGLTIIGQSVNAVVATVLWAYLASVAILMGGEFNAAVRRRRAVTRTAANPIAVAPGPAPDGERAARLGGPLRPTVARRRAGEPMDPG